MTDEVGGMEGSNHRILIKRAASAALVAGACVVAGCGGGGSNSATPSAPVTQASSGGGGLVVAEGTQGLVGSAGRATSKSQQFRDKTGKIPRTANHKPRKSNGGVGAGADCPDIDITPSDSNLDQVNAAILCLVNGERTDNGNLPQLTPNAQLTSAASGMCQRMVTEQFFAHDTPDGKSIVDRIEPTGYIPNGGDWVVGENLAWGSGALSTPQAIVNGWMNSPGHKANILAPDYKDIGLSVCLGSPTTQYTGGTTYVNDFGAKSGADYSVTLPPESGSTGNTASSASVGTQAVLAAKARAKAKARARARTRARARARARTRARARARARARRRALARKHHRHHKQ
jgi:uncharacterized protein YkwD